MQRTKLLVIVFFILLSLTGIGHRWLSPTVTGQSGGLSAPTGVIASDGSYINKVGLYWDTIRGATGYRIFRNTTNDTATSTVVGTTVMNNFFDPTAVAGQMYFYWIKAESGTTSSDFSTPDQGFRSNGTINGPVPPLEPPPAPPGNPVTATKAYLGKALFWDEQLSSTKTVSCGTCHQAGKGGSDARSLINNPRSTNPGFDNVFGSADDVFGSPGVPLNNADGTYSLSSVYGMREQVTNRKSNSFINAVYSNLLFWDGRATGIFRDPITNAVVLNGGAALESQAAGPPVSSAEMAHSGRNWNDVAARVVVSKPLALSPSVPTALQTWINGRSYPELFTEAFGTPDVTPSRIAMAIAAFERTLYSDQTPFDLDAGGVTPLTPQEQRGRGVFNQAQCNVCHVGNLFTDNTFRNIGVRPAAEDTGRFAITGNANDIGEFRVPGLRNVELRAPYMHNGRFATLEEVVEFYNRGGDFPNEPNVPNNLIRPRNLTVQQRADLAAFLRRPLTDPRVAAQTAPFDSPQLYSQSNRVPVVSGVGRAGSNNIVPQVTAIEPPILGNQSFAIGLSNALGNRQALLVIDNNDPGIGTTIPTTGSFARITINLSGTGAGNGFGSVSLQIPNNPSLIGRTFFGRWYVTDEGAANGFSVSQAFRFTVFGEATATTRAKFVDFDGDGKTDVSVFRPSEGNWYITNSSNNAFSATHFGLSGDLLTPADYDGDGRTDIAVFRDGVWYLMRSRDGFTAIQFGLAGDKPQAGDYDGDGLADLAVFRPSDRIWYIQRSRDGFSATQFGLSTDRAVANDYDGDGKTDIAVYHDGVWYLLQSASGFKAVQFGLAEDKPVLGDYDGDGKSDLAVWRPSTGVWYHLRSSDNNFRAVQFGISTDAPTPGDYDGDGLFDYAVFRPSEGNWYILHNANNAFRVQNFGLSQDIAVPSSIVP